jgi:hypothetical protein
MKVEIFKVHATTQIALGGSFSWVIKLLKINFIVWTISVWFGKPFDLNQLPGGRKG